MHEKQTEPFDHLPSQPETPTTEISETVPSGDKTEITPETLRIQTLNDVFRSTFINGRIVLTQAIQALTEEKRRILFGRIQKFSNFTEDNDPYHEHDFGILSISNETYYWKIDYYNNDLSAGSEDASDPEITTRVLTIMHRSEY